MTINKYPIILLQRRAKYHEKLTALMTDFEAYLIAQSYGGVNLDRARTRQFTAVVHRGQITFLRRVEGVDPCNAWGREDGVHFVTSDRVPSYLKAIEGRVWPRCLRRVTYVNLCHDVENDLVWIEDEKTAERIC